MITGASSILKAANNKFSATPLQHYFATTKKLVVPHLSRDDVFGINCRFPTATTLIAVGWDLHATTNYLKFLHFPNVQTIMLDRCVIDESVANNFRTFCAPTIHLPIEQRFHFKSQHYPGTLKYRLRSPARGHPSLMRLPGVKGEFDSTFVHREFLRYCEELNIYKWTHKK